VVITDTLLLATVEPLYRAQSHAWELAFVCFQRLISFVVTIFTVCRVLDPFVEEFDWFWNHYRRVVKDENAKFERPSDQLTY